MNITVTTESKAINNETITLLVTLTKTFSQKLVSNILNSLIPLQSLSPLPSIRKAGKQVYLFVYRVLRIYG